jgi:hypothetical protein
MNRDKIIKMIKQQLSEGNYAKSGNVSAIFSDEHTIKLSINDKVIAKFEYEHLNDIITTLKQLK